MKGKKKVQKNINYFVWFYIRKLKKNKDMFGSCFLKLFLRIVIENIENTKMVFLKESYSGSQESHS